MTSLKCIQLWLLAYFAMADVAHAHRNLDAEETIREKIQLYRQEYLKTVRLDRYLDNSDVGKLGRTKRATVTADNPLFLGRQGRKVSQRDAVFLLKNTTRLVFPLLETVKTLDINSIIFQNQTLMATLEVGEDLNLSTMVVVYRVSNMLKPSEIAREKVPGALTVEAFVIENHVYVFPLVYNKTKDNSYDSMDVGSTLFKVDFIQRKLVKVQVIPTAHSKRSAFWEGSGDDAKTTYLAIAPEFKDRNGSHRFSVQIPCYRWQGGYFDYVSSVPANSPQGIKHFNILSKDYLAVANFQDDFGSMNIHSEIFRYEHKQSKFVPFQRIRTKGARDIEHFSFKSGKREEHFLAIANYGNRDETGYMNVRVKSFIMKFAGHRFVPFKSFYTHGAYDFVAVNSGDKFFLVLGEIERLYILQYNGWSFQRVYYQHIPSLSVVNNFRNFLYKDKPLFSLSSATDSFRGGVFSGVFEERNDKSELSTSLYKWCNEALSRLQVSNIPEILTQLTAAPTVDDPEIRLKGDVSFRNPLIVNEVSTLKLNNGETKIDETLLYKLHDRQIGFFSIQTFIRRMLQKLENVIFTNRDILVQTPLVVHEILINNPNFDINVLNAKYINDRHVEQDLKNIIFTNSPANIQRLVLNDGKFIEDANFHTSLLNGAQLQDYVLTSRPGTFLDRNVFKEEAVVFGDATVYGHFAGVKFQIPVQFLLAEGNQTFDKSVFISDSSVANLYTKVFNGMDLLSYFNDAVPLHGNVTITAPKRFSNISADYLFVKSLVNGADIDRVLNSGIDISGRSLSQNYSSLSFDELHVNHIDVANPLINNKYDLNKYFVHTRRGYYQFGELLLVNNSSVHHLNITNRLNGYSVGNGDFGFLIRESQFTQIIRRKTLPWAHFIHDVTADKKFGGVDINNWSPIQKIRLRRTHLYRPITVFGTIKTPAINVKKSLKYGNQDILPVLKHITMKNTTRLPGKCDLRFESLHVLGETDVLNSIDDLKPSYLVPKNSNKTWKINGVVHVNGDLYLNDNAETNALLVPYRLKQVDILPFLANGLVDGADQDILQDAIFMEPLKVENLNCTAITLDGVPFENLLLRTVEQDVEVKTILEGFTKANDKLHVFGDAYVGIVNQVNISEAISDTLRTTGINPQTVFGSYTFEGGLVADNVVTKGLVSNIDIVQLFNSIVRKSQTVPFQIYNSQVIFFDKMISSSLLYSGTLNSISDGDWGGQWLVNGKNQTIYTPVEFLDVVNVTMGVHSSNGTVNGINIDSLPETLLFIDQDEYISNVHFLDEVDVSCEVSLNYDATFNGIIPEKDLLLKQKNKSQTLEGKTIFERGLNISEANVSTLNGADMDSLLEFFFGENLDAFNDHYLTVIGDLILIYEPTVETYNGISPENVRYDPKYWFSDKNVTFNSPVKFYSAQFKESVFNGTLNGVNLKELGQTYVSKTNHQEWTGKVIITDAKPAKFFTLETEKLNIDNEVLNNINIVNFLRSLLLNGTEQEISLNPQATLHANTLDIRDGPIVSGIDLTKNVMDIHGRNVSRMNILHNAELDQLDAKELILSRNLRINGIGLEDWYNNAVKSNENLHLPPLVLDNLNAKNVEVLGYVDGVKVDRHSILVNNMDQIIPNKVNVEYPKHGHSAVLAPNGVEVDGLYNNRNISSDFDKLVLKGKNPELPLVIKGAKQFKAPLYARNLSVHNLFQGTNLSKLLDNYYYGDIIPSNYTFRAKERYDNLHYFTEEAVEVSSRAAVFLEYWVLSQNIFQASGRISYTRMTYGDKAHFLGIGVEDAYGRTVEQPWVYKPKHNSYQYGNGFEINMSGKIMDTLQIETLHRNFILYILDVNPKINRPKRLRSYNSTDSRNVNKPGNVTRLVILNNLGVRNSSLSNWEIAQKMPRNSAGLLESFIVFSSGIGKSCFLITDAVHLATGAEIFCLKKYTFEPYQTIPLQNPYLVTSTETYSKTLLNIVTEGIMFPEKLLEVWSHEDSSNSFIRESCIPVYNPVDIDSIYAPNNNTFLAIASGASSDGQYMGAVFVYKYSYHKLEYVKIQTLESEVPIKIRFMVLEGSKEVLLITLSQSQVNNVQVHKYQGISGWNLRHKWSVPGAEMLEVADFEVAGHYRAYIIVSSSNNTNLYVARFKGESRINISALA